MNPPKNGSPGAPVLVEGQGISGGMDFILKVKFGLLIGS